MVYKSKKVSYTGKDAAQMFVEMLIEDIGEIANISRKEMDDLTPSSNINMIMLQIVGYATKNLLKMIERKIIR